jgi:hypothetical protein
MFDTLEEQIERTEDAAPSPGARAARYAGLWALTVVVFGALYMVIRMVE